MKKILTVFILLIAVFSLTAFADGYSLLYDGADLLTYQEEEILLPHLDKLSNEYGFDIAVVTSYDLMGYYSAESAATEYYEAHYGYDGILLFISMADRDYYVVTSGECDNRITYNELGYLEDEFIDSLSNGYYLDAFSSFAENAVLLWENDTVYEAEVDTSYPLLKNAVIAFVAGLVIALIVTGIMKGQLKSVKNQVHANQYTKDGSMKVTVSNDIFLYRNVTKTRKSNSSSSGSGSHRSSSGRSYGGRGGKF